MKYTLVKNVQYQFRETQIQCSYWNTERKGIVKSESKVAHTPKFHRWVRGFKITKAVMGQDTALSEEAQLVSTLGEKWGFTAH